MRLVQFLAENGQRRVAVVSEDGRHLQPVRGAVRLYDLALEAGRRAVSLSQLLQSRLSSALVDYEQVATANRLLPPLDHPDPAHCIVSGTGLDHLGSAKARDAMHAKLNADAEALTDSMRMFQWGLEGGKPAPGQVGTQPEWFYKGDGSWIAPPGHPLELPAYALDGGEEPELVGLYVVAESGAVLRVGFALGNEFSDHVLERQNYLYLAHSKLRTCSIGPELRVDPLPESISGTSRILRDGAELWADSFLTGEANMSHSIANIEHHHFKYSRFRRPGDIHCHFFGTATLSSAAGIVPKPGDIFEISAPGFGRPLRNPLAAAAGGDSPVAVQAL